MVSSTNVRDFLSPGKLIRRIGFLSPDVMLPTGSSLKPKGSRNNYDEIRVPGRIGSHIELLIVDGERQRRYLYNGVRRVGYKCEHIRFQVLRISQRRSRTARTGQRRGSAGRRLFLSSD